MIAAVAALFAASDRTTSNVDPAAIDRSCKPCDDFFQFALGSWMDKNPIPATQSRWGKISKGAENTQFAMRDIAESLAAKKGANAEEKDLAAFYAACMDVEAIDALGIKPIETTLARIRAIATRDGIAEEIRLQASRGNFLPFGIGPSPSTDDPTKVIAAISPAPWL